MRAAQFLAIIGRGSKGSNALENTEDRAGATSEQQDNVINTVNSLDPYGPSWQLVPGNVAAGTVYAQVPTSGTGDLAFTRASTATRTDASGNIVNVASGVGRIHYRNADGSLSSTGRLLLEPQRTNSIRNSTMVGAVAGSPGTLPTNWSVNNLFGLTQTIGTIGTESGLSYIDFRFNGIANASGSLEIRSEAPTQIAALNSQVWTNSTYVKLVANPSPANSIGIGIYERNSVGTALTFGQQTITPTTSIARFTFTRTLVGGATVAFVQPSITFNLTTGATYDFTIRIAAPQMELGATATTFIPTTTAAVTRVLDAFVLDGLQSNGILSNTGLTWYTKFSKRIGTGADAYPRLEDAASNNVIGFSTTANTLQSSVRTAGGSFDNTNILLSYTGQFVKACFTLSGTTLKVFVNGSLVLTTTAPTSSIYTRLRSLAVIDKDASIEDSFILKTPLSDSEAIQRTTL